MDVQDVDDYLAMREKTRRDFLQVERLEADHPHHPEPYMSMP
jgi:hypothetical protein